MRIFARSLLALIVILLALISEAHAQDTVDTVEAPAEQGIAMREDPPAPCTILMPEGSAFATYVTNTWPGGVVPYEFNTNVNALNQQRALSAMAEIELIAGVDFVPRAGHSNYILITNSSCCNNSYVGMIGGGQTINITSWSWRFIIVHELMHALGFWHEQQRPDRNEYVQILWDNVCQNCCGGNSCDGNFTIMGTAYGVYDFDSVMHYGQCDFTECGQCTPGCRTIQVLPPNESWQNHIGQRDHLSTGDIDGLGHLYGPPPSLRWVDFDYSGPENGSFNQPYNTLQEALNTVAAGGTIRIKTGSTAATLTINQSVNIEAYNGSVTVGQ